MEYFIPNIFVCKEGSVTTEILLSRVDRLRKEVHLEIDRAERSIERIRISIQERLERAEHLREEREASIKREDSLHSLSPTNNVGCSTTSNAKMPKP